MLKLGLRMGGGTMERVEAPCVASKPCLHKTRMSFSG